jgi:hypothetical protein
VNINPRDFSRIVLRILLFLVFLVFFGIIHRRLLDPGLAAIHVEWFWSIYNSIDFLTIPLFAFGCIVPVAAGVLMEGGRRFWGIPTVSEIGFATLIYVISSWATGSKGVFLVAATPENIPSVFVLVFVPLLIVHLFTLFIFKRKHLKD